jgi:hypothetical protein
MTPASSPTGDTAAVPPVPTLDRDGFDERFVMAAAEANRAGEDVGHLPTVADELYSMVQRRDAEIDRLRAELAEEKREHLATINDALRVKQAWAAREQTLAAPPAASSSPDDTARPLLEWAMAGIRMRAKTCRPCAEFVDHLNAPEDPHAASAAVPDTAPAGYVTDLGPSVGDVLQALAKSDRPGADGDTEETR